MSKPNSNEPTGGKHERRDINVPAVAGFAVGLAVGILLVCIATRGMLGMYGKHRLNDTESFHTMQSAALPPKPRLQADPARDYAHFQNQENSRLDSYGWVDRESGVVHIPVEQAMDLIAQRGLPKPPPDSIGKTPLQLRQEKGIAP